MTKRLSIASAVLTALSALLALFLLSTPALAHHNADHDKGKGSTSTSASDKDGDADSDANTAYTEDNDTNDNNTPNNVSDDGDNAHPSGKDRSVENGNSGTQGKSESNPDDSKGPMRYEGELGDDKANGPGGTDLADQDGNNGCGNDDDFDDDNNGWCGKPKEEAPPVVEPATETPCVEDMATTDKECGETVTPPEDVVLGDDIENCPKDDVMGSVSGSKDCGEDDEVLGSIISNEEPEVAPAAVAAERAPRGAVLPFTGANVVLFLVLAMGLLGVGFALLRTRRN